MGPTTRQTFGAFAVVAVTALSSYAQTIASEQPTGAYLVTSGGDQIDASFRKLIVRSSRKLVFIPTAASFLRSKYGIIWNPDNETNRAAFIRELLLRFDVVAVEILHTRSREIANTDDFVKGLRNTDAVWISGGNAGRLADAYLDTRVVDELKAVVSRGGIVAGESAGAMIQGSYVVRGNPDKPVLMAEGRERGFGILPNIAINPHLSASKRENELVSVIDRYPHLLGIGIDDDAGLLIRGTIGEAIGPGRVAVYDNERHPGVGWYFWLNAGDKLDLKTRKALPATTQNGAYQPLRLPRFLAFSK